MLDFDIIVVGNGLIGSAAGRYLAELGERVALIGQEEPPDPTTHDGVFASHYDQRRLAHVTGRSKHWMMVKRQALDDFKALEQQSGIKFHDPVGYLGAIPPHLLESEEAPHRIAAQLGVPHYFYPAGDDTWRKQFPEYNFPDSYALLSEPEPAGAINPRAMREAQNVVAHQQGISIFSALVEDIEEQAGGISVTTRGGEQFTARKVLLATGAFTNSFNLLPAKLALNLKTEVVLLGEVSASDMAHLSTLPTVGYRLDDPQIMEAYMTPAARHDNGRCYIKLGANSIYDQFLDHLEQIQLWFREGQSDILLPPMQAALRTMMPNTKFLSFETKRCIVTRTPNAYPMIDQLSEGLFVAVGGNGGSAQCASVWGNMAAELTFYGQWTSKLPRNLFRATLSEPR